MAGEAADGCSPAGPGSRPGLHPQPSLPGRLAASVVLQVAPASSGRRQAGPGGVDTVRTLDIVSHLPLCPHSLPTGLLTRKC